MTFEERARKMFDPNFPDDTKDTLICDMAQALDRLMAVVEACPERPVGDPEIGIEILRGERDSYKAAMQRYSGKWRDAEAERDELKAELKRTQEWEKSARVRIKELEQEAVHFKPPKPHPISIEDREVGYLARQRELTAKAEVERDEYKRRLDRLYEAANRVRGWTEPLSEPPVMGFRKALEAERKERDDAE